MTKAVKMQCFDFEDWKRRQQNRKADLPLSDRALSMPELSEKVGISRSKIYKMMRQGIFPNGKLFGARSRRWLESEIDTWMDSREG